MTSTENLAPLRTFVIGMSDLIDAAAGEAAILAGGTSLLARLIAQDDWLPDAYAAPSPDRYSQYLLHCDSRERFSVVSFVWGPGQSTPIHDHRTWGLIGMLRGAERSESWVHDDGGRLVRFGADHRLTPGDIEQLSPSIGDIHRVFNDLPDRPSISIHVYGANIGRVRRAAYAPDGTDTPFVSGYSNTSCPNFWGE